MIKAIYFICIFIPWLSLARGDAYFESKASRQETRDADELGGYRGGAEETVEERLEYSGVFSDVLWDATASPVPTLSPSPLESLSVRASSNPFSLSPAVLRREARYDGHVLAKLNGLSAASLAALESRPGYDVWSASSDSAVVFLSHNDYLEMKRQMHMQSAPGGEPVLLNEHLQSLIDAETERLSTRRVSSKLSEPLDWFSDFHTVEETWDWYVHLAAIYPAFVQLVPSIGTTAEGRSIFVVKIGNYSSTTATTEPSKPKKAIFLHALQHAREWISGSTINYIVYHLLQLYARPGEDPQGPLSPWPPGRRPEPAVDASVLDRVEFIVVPIMNPDGYAYTWTTNRLWRKNRSAARDGPFGRRATGVDLNRNWEDHWGVTGSSSNPFSDVYMGPGPASELEVQAMQNVFLNHTNIVAAVDFHAYSQLLLWPYGYTREPYRHDAEHLELAKRMIKRIDSIHGRSFTAERICELYMASGNALDFWSGERVFRAFGGHSPYTLAFELRPSMDDPRGFVLPPSEIVRAGQDVFSSILEMVQYVVENPLQP